MAKKFIITSASQGCVLLFVAAAFFVLLEPTIGFGDTSALSQFTISETIGTEVSFQTAPTNVTLSPSLGGLTGGDATGTTQVVVTSTGHLGYHMTIQASSSVGMLGNLNSSNSIPAYTTQSASTSPDFNFTVAANAAAFGYSVEASTTADVVQQFKNNGTVCNAGSNNGLGHCWFPATSTAYTIINTSAASPGSGSTSTLDFHVKIQSNPSPVIPDDTYVATTTLTALAN